MELCDDLIRDTYHAEKLAKFKLDRGLKESIDGLLVGTSWYKGFVKRHKEMLKLVQCKVQDSKRHTWCTYANF
jgi:hypothetical protein